MGTQKLKPLAMANEVAAAHPPPVHELQRQPSTSTPEYRTLQSCYPLLVSTIKHAGGVSELCDFLFSERLVTQSVLENVRNQGLDSDKARKVIDTVMGCVARDSNNYHKFLAVLTKQSDQWSEDVVKSLEEAYRNECSQNPPACSKQPSANSIPSSSSTLVKIGSLPSFINEFYLKKHFSQFKGQIVKIEIAKRKEKIEGYIFFSDQQSAEAAVRRMNGSLLENKYPIKVELAEEDKPLQPFPSQTPPSVLSPSRTLPAAPSPPSVQGESHSELVSSTGWPSPPELNSQAAGTNTPSSVASPSAQVVDSGPTHSNEATSKQTPEHFSTYRQTSNSRKPAESSSDSRYEQFTVKLTCLHRSLTPQDLSDVLSQFGPLLHLPRIIESKNRYALANFTILEDAERAIRGLNQRILCGRKINVSMKNGPPVPSSTLPEPVIDSLERLINALNIQYGSVQSSKSASKNPSKPSFTVKLTRLPPSCTPEHLADLLKDFGELHQPPRIFDEKNRYALANFTTLEGAQNAVTSLNRSNLFGYTINVSMKNQVSMPPHRCYTAPIGLGLMSVPAQPPYASPLDTSSFPSPPQPHHTASLSVQRSASYPGIHYPRPPPHSFGIPAPQSQTTQQTLKLLPADWNRLMAIGATGRALFYEIMEPYQTNPSIQIIPDIHSLSVWFSGHPDAVSSAYKRVCAEVQRETVYETGLCVCVCVCQCMSIDPVIGL